MALIRRRAYDGIASGTYAGLAGVCLQACIAIAANRAVELRGIGACARRRVADSCRMTLIGRLAYDRVASGACTGLAGIRLQAEVAVVASRAVRLHGVGACSRRRVACSCCMALIGGWARNGVAPCAYAGLARVCLGAGVAVVACCPVSLTGERADTIDRIAGSCRVTLVWCGASYGICAGAGAALAGIGLSAGTAITA